MELKNVTSSIKFLIITANVGSLFEEYGPELQNNWVSEFHKLVSAHKPTFIALHLQEVGGKTNEVNKEQICSFFQDLCEPSSFNDFTCIENYTDEEFVESKYTALGCSYFIHKSIKSLVEQWSFTENCFQSVLESRNTYTTSESTRLIRKFKFPLSCYSKHTSKFHRKGFTWTRWRLNKKVFDMLNIHLPHDASNVVCVLKSPTKYAKYRKRTLEYTQDRLNEMPSDHQLLIGDFNVRPDTKQLIKHLMKDIATQHLIDENHEDNSINHKHKPSSIIYKSVNSSKTDILKVESRRFEFSNYEAFNIDRVPYLLPFDKELDCLKKDKYKEMKITFQPTYPYNEDPNVEQIYSFSNVRCPSWCDRILLDTKLHEEITKGSTNSIYDNYGTEVCIGDHKPVFLTFDYQID